MEEITITQKKQSFGFVKATEQSMPGVSFDNGKIAYLNANEEICAASDEKSLVKELKGDTGCIEVRVVRRYKA